MISMNIKSDDGPVSEYDASPCIYLNDDQVEALGIKGMPAPGTVFKLVCRAVVKQVSATAEEADETATEGNAPDVSLTLCITDMEASQGKDSGELATALYGKDA